MYTEIKLYFVEKLFLINPPLLLYISIKSSLSHISNIEHVDKFIIYHAILSWLRNNVYLCYTNIAKFIFYHKLFVELKLKNIFLTNFIFISWNN